LVVEGAAFDAELAVWSGDRGQLIGVRGEPTGSENREAGREDQRLD
jgi:hypothetical protein